MARGRKYGRTWWGNAWVEALERIDQNTNRLPRGRSYANAGRVSEIKIDATGRVYARVKGTRPTPYKIEIRLNEFSQRAKETAGAIIAEDPALAAELSMGRLPENILQLLEKHNISLLPESWNDIIAHCSCPDWANPCKHLAAVYYIMANEIDKDPLILFKLHNIKPRELMREAGFIGKQGEGYLAASEELTEPFPCFPAAGTPAFAPYQETIIPLPGSEAAAHKTEPAEEIPVDLSALADSKESESIFTLLGDTPLFYSGGDFKALLLKAYKNISRSVSNLMLLENNFSFKDMAFTLIYPTTAEINKFLLDNHSKQRFQHKLYFFISLLTASGERKSDPNIMFSPAGENIMLDIPVAAGEKMVLKRKRGVLLPAEAVWDLFLALPFKLSAHRTSPWTDFLCATTALAQALARSSSFIPVLRSLDTDKAKTSGQGNFYVVYRPMDRSGKLPQMVEYLASIMPPGMIFCRKEKGILEGTAAVEELLTLILTHLVDRFSDINPSAGDKTVRAFFCGEPYLVGKFEEEQTAKAISDWLGWLNLRPNEIAPVLKIGLPRSGSEKFSLKVYVENKKDPLAPVLPLKELFTDKKELFSRPTAFARREIAHQLTIAGAHIPILKKLLSHKGNKQANLSPPNLAEFVTGGQQICSLLGIRVMVPKELKQMAVPRLALAARTAKSSEKNVSYFNLDEMLEFTWQVSLGDVTMTGEEFRRLAESASGVVKFKEQYLLLKPQEVESILAKLRNPVPRLSSMEVLRAAATGEAAGAVFNPDRMLQQLVNDLSMPEEVVLPTGLQADLRPYQHRGFKWLYNLAVRGLGSCLADDMGLGKTIQVIAVLLKLSEQGWLTKPALVVCPTTLIGNWVKECSKFAPSLKVAVYHGSDRRLNTKGVDLMITSYGILRRDRVKFKRNIWSLVIIDEAQNIKNPESDQTRAVKALSAGARIAMSGTPVENRLMEMWSIFDFINSGYLGERKNFANSFSIPIEKYRDKEIINRFKKATAPFLLRRLKSDRSIIKDLPPKVIKEENCYLSKEQASLYQQVLEQVMSEIEQSEGITRKGMVFKLITSLKQICNHPVQYSKKGKVTRQHSGKAAKALDLLEQIAAAGEKTLVFTQYKEMGELLVELIRDELQIDALFFHGGVSRQKRDAMVEEFQKDKDAAPVMVVSLKAGGTGLNLTAATHVIHYDLWWNPAVEDQATDRTYRIGQTRTVLIHRLISLGTFEEKINTMMASKRELAELAVATGESSISELSNAELKELFRLVQHKV
ncbi:SNF2-related protein [Desulfoscipio gibsoniae]|uniref:DNA/RNA helicase, superfamily II, SNF2 family n=1 Tax=Desulfoscipio gibsoniae DSM 7213 TaxID=767817 RepID=R4KUM5_9FIRM|nr:SNF2-related protein [Desulfoscipio gibsoniae]AGL03321.1 DNA/RNA helicase, superfamily II, SNF2 family [Desulfoscipio gibsoniae DSM 7213]